MVRPEPPAEFSALQTTKPSSHRWIRRGSACDTILRPGAPTTSPMKRMFRGMLEAPGGRGRAGGPGSSRELDGPRLAEDGDLDLAGVGQLRLHGLRDVAAELGRVLVPQAMAVGDH